MPITLLNNTISGLALGGLPSNVVTTATLANNSVTAAKLLHGTAFSLAGGSTANATGGGRHRFPNGIIMQWSSYRNQSAEQNYTYSFPITFPSGCFRVIVGTTTIDGSRDAMFQLRGFTNSQFTVFQNQFNAAGGSQNCHMVAFGN